MFKGDRGEPFRTFKRDFLVDARGQFAKDDQFSYHTAYVLGRGLGGGWTQRGLDTEGLSNPVG